MRVKHVLLTTDGTPRSVAGAREAVELLGPDARYQLVHVVDPVPPVSPSGRFAAQAVADAGEERRRADADDVIARTLQELPVRPVVRVESGDPSTVIREIARRDGCDVVAVTDRDAGLLERIVLGSVSGEVANSAPCAVLVTRPEDDDRDASSGTTRGDVPAPS